MTAFERHDFVRLRADWRNNIAAPLSDPAVQHIAAWQEAGHPFVVAAHGHGDGEGTLRLGLAGPGKTRLGFLVKPEGVARVEAPPLLRDIAPRLPRAWQKGLAQVEAVGPAFDLEIRVFGSSAWQALTGLGYLTPTSDIDLLVATADPSRRDAGLAALAALHPPMRLDGEIRVEGAGDIAWREWLSGAKRLLMKTRHGPKLLKREQLQ